MRYVLYNVLGVICLACYARF